MLEEKGRYILATVISINVLLASYLIYLMFLMFTKYY